MPTTLREAVSNFGVEVRAKLTSVAAAGEPEDQLRSPLEALLRSLGELAGFRHGQIILVGETSLSDLKTRPDYAVSVNNALAGFIEVKAPGKGADPRRYRGHDKAQWERLKSLPNLIYTDGNEFSLWRSGELVDAVVRLIGSVEDAGSALHAPPTLQLLFESFFRWHPVPPRTAKQLADTTARLCRLLRDEVEEQLDRDNAALTQLASDWRHLLFPQANNAQFADGYAQAVTFGLLMARARGIPLSSGLAPVAAQLGRTNSLIGGALRLLTDDAENQSSLKTSLGTLVRVLDAVDWSRLTRADADAWLYFYEDFLDVYDRKLRKETGSYYTPPEVVQSMVRLVDEALRGERYALPAGLASPEVRLADPAVGTGTFLLGVFRRIAETVARDQGAGAVAASVESAMRRVIAFEIQLGPFAVAQLRVLAELTELTGAPPVLPLRMFVADTLSNPYEEAEEWVPQMLGAIAESRRQANEVKRDESITVVIGNPPYKERARGRGGWVESGGLNPAEASLLSDWQPPVSWGVSAHAKHLRNLYIYFWRWAAWKAFDQQPGHPGIVCFISVAGFLNGPGFQRMREYLRQKTDEIWVVDCSPEGHQPEVSSRIFEGVQQPICIVLASRSPTTDESLPARVCFHALPEGHRDDKFAALGRIALDDDGWTDCASEWRASFFPEATGAWSTYPALDALFKYDGSGVMPGRTWVIAPDVESLERRWRTLTHAPATEKEALFHPHMRRGQLGDRHSQRVMRAGLAGHAARAMAVASDTGPMTAPVRYGFRSFDRQWIIPDNRLLNQPNPELWRSYSVAQLFLTAPSDRSPSGGPSLTFSAAIPDLHHYAGRGGRVLPLWANAAATEPNVTTGLLEYLSVRFAHPVTAPDVLAYLAGVMAHPAFTSRFQADLVQPGLRVPITANAVLFEEAVTLGREVIWLHTYGERFSDTGTGRAPRPPRATGTTGPTIPAGGAIPSDSEGFPDTLEYDPASGRLHVGRGYVDGVSPAVWVYEVSGKPVVKQWFSYRRRNRDRPVIGDRRPPSRLGEIQPERWPSEYTTELLDLLHVLTRLVALEPSQNDLLDRICAGAVITEVQLSDAGALHVTAGAPSRTGRTEHPEQHTFLD
jgi:hypothetical protein